MAERQERNGRQNERDGAPPQLVAGDAAYRAELLQIQEVDFALVELTLYLDTHPHDMQAVQQFNQLAQQRRQLLQPFEMRYGPLLGFGNSFTRFPWQWSQTPWPWQV